MHGRSVGAQSLELVGDILGNVVVLFHLLPEGILVKRSNRVRTRDWRGILDYILVTMDVIIEVASVANGTGSRRTTNAGFLGLDLLLLQENVVEVMSRRSGRRAWRLWKTAGDTDLRLVLYKVLSM